MKSEDELFLLIRSMDKNEKGYFRKASKLHGSQKDGNYLKLFDCIAAMDEYSDAAVREKFKNEKFTRQLSVAKNYLKSLILKTLKNYYESDPEIERGGSLLEIQVLMKKQLYDMALKQIRKHKQIAEEGESFLRMLSLIHLEYRIHLRAGSAQDILESSIQEQKYLRLYENLCEYRLLQARLLSVMRSDGSIPNGAMTAIREVLRHPLLKSEDKALSFTAKILQYESRSRTYHKLGDFSKAYDTAGKLVGLFKDHEDRIRQTPYNYYAALSSLFNRSITLRSYETARECISDIENLLYSPTYKHSVANSNHMLMTIHEMKLDLYSKTMAFKQGVEIDKHWSALNIKELPKTWEISTGFFSALCYFGLGNHDEALKRVNHLINGPFTEVRTDLMLSVLQLNLVIHYELGNYSLIPMLLKKMGDFIQTNEFPKELWRNFEKNFKSLAFAKSIDDKTAIRKYIKALRDLHDYDDLDRFMEWWIQRADMRRKT